MGAADHYAAAQEHDRDAERERELASAAEQRGGAPVSCGDQNLAAQSTSGGAPVSLVVPCWTSRDVVRAHRDRAESLERDARVHRAKAKALIEAADAACAPLPEAERDHSPSLHRDDILAVEPLTDAKGVHGARLVFRKVAGLTPDWLRTAYACTQAEAAVHGYDSAYLGYCPGAIADVAVAVADRADGIVVEFRADTSATAQAVLGRAQDLTKPAPPDAP